ncbi:MAG: hypothetical protein ACLFVR_09865 [Thiohalospira sp.]
MATEEKRNDEIDLIEVFQKMGQGIKNLFNNFLNFLYKVLLFLIRRAMIIGIVLILFLAYGAFKYKTSPSYYSSTLEAYSNVISSTDMINYINNINELSKEKDLQTLESKLGIDSTELKKIKSVKAYKVIDLNKDGVTDIVDFNNKYATSDTTISETRFVIKVEVLDQSVFPIIQNSILDYIESNTYIKELNTIRKRQIQELISKLNDEISLLDSLKKYEYFKKQNQLTPQAGQLLVMNEKETQLYHEQIISLYREKQLLEERLEIRTDPITIIQDFSALAVTENKLITYLKANGLWGIVFGLLIALFIENRKVIKKVFQDSRRQ